MNRERIVFLALFILAAVGLGANYFSKKTAPGKSYYQQVIDGSKVSLPEHVAVNMKGDDTVIFSLPRTFGLWIAGFCTLAIFSFLYRDNPFYKVAEHVFVGVSAAYYMVVGFWSTIVPNLLGSLFPRALKFTLLPSTGLDKILDDLHGRWYFNWLINYDSAQGDGFRAAWWQLMDWAYWVPMILGIMLLWRLAPKGQWIARWPLAFIIGTTAGIRLVAFLKIDFIQQIANTIDPTTVGSLYRPVYEDVNGQDVFSFGKTFYQSFSSLLLILGVLCSLIYFFFSLEHKGVVGATSRVGIWVLMITFGAGFGYTVMGRIALLTGRFKFIVSEWLNLVPP